MEASSTFIFLQMVALQDEMNIWVAASDGNSDLVIQYLKSMSPDSRDENGYTPLHAAASYGHLGLIKLLISQYNANPNITDEDGDTPLHVVCDLASCELLVELGADPNQRNLEGKLPIESAHIEAHDDIVTYLKAFTPDFTEYEQETGDDAMLERVMNELQDENQ